MFCFHIQGRSRIIHDEYRCIFGKGSGDADALFLTTGQTNTTFTNDRVIGIVHFFNETACLGSKSCLADCFQIYDITFAKLHVLCNGIREEEDILHNERDTATQLAKGQVTDIHTIQADDSISSVIEPLQKLYDRGFACACCAHDSNCLTRLYRKGDIMQNLMHIFLMERYMGELNLTFHVIQNDRIG